MRLVEAITGELLHQVEDVHRQLAVDAVVPGSLLKHRALLGHLLRLFLPHRTAQQIRPAQRVAGQHLGDLHHLFLVQDDAVSRLQHRLQAFMLPLAVRVGELLTPMLTVDEVIHHPRLQRPRSEQRHQGDHIFEAVWLQPLDQILHPTRFQLEYRRGFRALQDVETLLIIERDGGDIHRLQPMASATRVDHLQRPVDDGQGTQAEEVKLHQPGILHVALIELRDRMIPLGIAIQWRKIGDLGGGDHHPTGMFTGVACHPFQLAGHVDQRAHLFVRLVDLRQLRLRLEGLGQGHARIGRHQLGDAVDEAVRMPQDATDITDHRLGRHGAEGDDLRHRLATIHLGDVIDHPIAFLHAEVDVEVGHRDTFRVEEAFEQQIEG